MGEYSDCGYGKQGAGGGTVVVTDRNHNGYYIYGRSGEGWHVQKYTE
jgi:hypothetical protein